MIKPEPYMCPPLTAEMLREYKQLMHAEVSAPALRSWVREADKACRANEQLLKEIQ